MVVFGELSNQGWVTPDNACTSYVAAVDLATGNQRWRFDVPIFKSLILPTLHTSDDGSQLLLQVQIGSWNKETFRFFRIEGGKAAGTWNSRFAPQSVAVGDKGGRVALAFAERLLEVRQADGALVYNMYWHSQPVSVAFAADGQGLYVADDAGRLTCLDAAGAPRWHVELGCTAKLAAGAAGVYAACWDGRVRALDPAGKARWSLDCTPALLEGDPMAAVVATATEDGGPAVVRAIRPATTVADVPAGENLLRTGAATLTLGGTKGWMSDGKLLVKGEALTNGQAADVTTPWLHLDEVFWDAHAGRQVWAEIAFKQPTDVRAVTVCENPAFPASWPTEGLVQVWNEALKRWDTAAFGVFLTGPVNTYKLDLKGVSRIRYLPWNSYYRNFFTCEIEVR